MFRHVVNKTRCRKGERMWTCIIFFCKSERNPLSSFSDYITDYAKGTFSITFYLSDCVADVGGSVCYSRGWDALKLSRSAKHLPLALCHFLHYQAATGKVLQEHIATGMILSSFGLDHVALVKFWKIA